MLNQNFQNNSGLNETKRQCSEKEFSTPCDRAWRTKAFGISFLLWNIVLFLLSKAPTI